MFENQSSVLFEKCLSNTLEVKSYQIYLAIQLVSDEDKHGSFVIVYDHQLDKSMISISTRVRDGD